VFESMGWLSKVIESVAKECGFSTLKPLGKLDERAIKIILYGFGDDKKFRVGQFMARYEGVVPNLLRRYKETKSDYIRNEIEKYMVKEPCKVCAGTRLKKEVLTVAIDGKSIWDVSSMSVDALLAWVNRLRGFSEPEGAQLRNDPADSPKASRGLSEGVRTLRLYFVRKRANHRQTHPQGNHRSVKLPSGCRAFLPNYGAVCHRAFRRRSPAHPAGVANW